MREPEGIESHHQESHRKGPGQKARTDIRNVEAEGSSSFTSTKSPVQRARSGSR